MQKTEHLKNVFDRKVKALTLRPSIGTGTAVTKVRIRDGLTCDIEEGSWKLVADFSQRLGGEDEGPNPGVYGRAALGSCLSISYLLWAAKLGVPISNLEVEIQADYNARGAWGVDDRVTPGYSQVRYIVTIESDAPEVEVQYMMDVADAHCPYLVVFSQAQDVRREVNILIPAPTQS